MQKGKNCYELTGPVEMQVQELVIRQFVCTEKATLKQKLSKLQIEALQQVLHQYTPKERLGTKTSTLDGQYWNVEDLAELVREQYGVEYQSRASYTQLLHLCGFSYQKTEKVFKSHSEMKVADFEEQLEKN